MYLYEKSPNSRLRPNDGNVVEKHGLIITPRYVLKGFPRSIKRIEKIKPSLTSSRVKRYSEALL
jgi:hypothetical protein